MVEPNPPIPSEALALLHRELPAGSDRLRHTVAVGQKAEVVVAVLGTSQPERVVVAAYLHDIGYAHAAVNTGMHQLDGARFLRGLGYDDEICCLVAHHSFAAIEARNKDLDAALDDEFPHPGGDLTDALSLVTYCDLTTSSTGEAVSIEDRFADIFARYPADHVVTRTMREAEPLARETVSRIQASLSAHS